MLLLLQHLNKQVNFKSVFFQQKILIKNVILIYVKLIIRIEKIIIHLLGFSSSAAF